MTSNYLETLNWIASQQNQMQNLLVQWVNCSSGSYNLAGLQKMKEILKESFKKLPCTIQEVEFSPVESVNDKGELIQTSLGPALNIQSEHKAPIKVLLSGHYDTVFGKDSPFQSIQEIDKTTLKGPGVTDMKGGLVILFYALKALERSPFSKKIEWEVIISGDEEIGSLGSADLLLKKARSSDIGLIFEPCLPNGSWVSERVGSANFTITFKGKSAHVGREFSLGRNALVSATQVANTLASWSDLNRGLIVNVGYLSGGGAVNVVPDLAVLKFNIRAKEKNLMDQTIENLKKTIEKHQIKDQVIIKLHTHCIRPPKPFDQKTKELFESFKECGEELGTPSQWEPSGGVCDGNLLGSVGLPTIDTLGALGGGIHTEEEYIQVEQLSKKAQLVTLFLMKLANGEFSDLKEKK